VGDALTAQWLNRLGLVLGIAGVVILFIWGPPQPNFEETVTRSIPTQHRFERRQKGLRHDRDHKAAEAPSSGHVPRRAGPDWRWLWRSAYSGVALIKRGLIVAAIAVLNIASALAEPVYCSVWNGIRTCSGPGDYVSHETTWNGITTGDDNQGGEWTTFRWRGH
jgi:hypothetical protein